jgi:hypothetical protein
MNRDLDFTDAVNIITKTGIARSFAKALSFTMYAYVVYLTFADCGRSSCPANRQQPRFYFNYALEEET